MTVFQNPSVRRDDGYRGEFGAAAYADVEAFYAGAPATPLRSSRALAGDAGIGALLIKDESGRFGLEAFKIAGARYAIARLGSALTDAGVVCATAGNHGRAVARAARDAAVACTVFIPAAAPGAAAIERRVRDARIAAMRLDGATTIPVNGTYEDALARASEHARRTGAAVVSDTSWPDVERIPCLIMLGYTHIFEECARQWDVRPDVMLVQAGVGGLLAAAANWLAWRYGPERPFLIGCEPESYACLLASVRAGHPVEVMTPPLEQPRRDQAPSAAGARPEADRGPSDQGPGTVMAGLRCARPSASAWPAILNGVDGFISVSDALAFATMERLRADRESGTLAAGPSGICSLAALQVLAGDDLAAPLRRACGWSRSTRAMVMVTEGP